jgi:archaellum component FlaC
MEVFENDFSDDEIQDGNFGDDIQDGKNDTDGLSDRLKSLKHLREMVDRSIEEYKNKKLDNLSSDKVKSLEHFSKMVDRSIEEYKNKKLDRVEQEMKVFKNNHFSNVSDDKKMPEGTMETAKSLENEISEENVGKLEEKDTKVIDNMVSMTNMITGHMGSMKIFPKAVKELKGVRGGLKEMKDRLREARSQEADAECKTHVLDEESSVTAEEDDKLDSMGPEESSRL